MTISQIPNNQFPSEPGLKAVLDLYKRFTLLELNCHHIGTIQSFDPIFQTAAVTINYQRTVYQLGSDGNYGPTLQSYPPMPECPVLVIGGGDGALTFPIAKGDECLVCFNDRDIDNWYAGQTTSGGVASARLHSFSDALVIVGFRSQANSLENYDTSNVILRNGLLTFLKLTGSDATLQNSDMTQVGTQAALALISTELGGTLGVALQTVLTDLATFATTQAAASTGPLAGLAAGFTALGTSIAMAASTLAEILA